MGGEFLMEEEGPVDLPGVPGGPEPLYHLLLGSAPPDHRIGEALWKKFKGGRCPGGFTASTPVAFPVGQLRGDPG